MVTDDSGEPIDHDRLFKELLTTFFTEFVDVFLPEVAAYLDRDSVTFLDKEIFTDLTSGTRHEADVVVRAKFRGTDTFFVVHVENQSTSSKEFARRMFLYFARLHEKFDLPIYPVVLFSFDTPKRAEPDRYRVAFPDRLVLDFQYRVIQLNRLNWRDYVQHSNPVATALMTKMKFAPRDRPKVKLECLRLLATLQLDDARSSLIGVFLDSYLRLNAAELKIYNQEFAALARKDQDKIMTYETSWHRKGRMEGRIEGRIEGQAEGLHKEALSLVTRLMLRRFEAIPTALREKLPLLTTAHLEDLVEALLDLKTIDDAERWIAAHANSETIQ